MTNQAEERRWTHADTVVLCVDRVDPELVEPLWEVYFAAFGPLRPVAAARQVLRRDEFADELSDHRVWKYVALDGDGHPVGLATLTADLESVPWISPEYYAARHPEHAARDAIFYVPFACTDPRRARHGVFWTLVRAFVERVSAADGVLGYDICTFNNAGIQFADRMERWYRRLGAHTVEQVDSQNYYVSLYGGAG